MKSAIKSAEELIEKAISIIVKEGIKYEKVLITKSENPEDCILEIAERECKSYCDRGKRAFSNWKTPLR